VQPTKFDPAAHLALKHNQLTSERGILSLKPADRPERRNQQPQKEEEQRDHPGRRYVILLPDQTDDVFGTHRYRTRTEGPSGARKTTMIVALARKLLIALWRLATTGEVPDGVELRPAA